MSIILPALAVAFAAFCVWLGLRIVNRREPWAKQLAVRLVVVGGYTYLIGSGPAFYAMGCGWLPGWAVRAIAYAYTPLIYVCAEIKPLDELLSWYIELWLH